MKKPLTPAAECARRVRKYLAIHQETDWDTIFLNVSSHYTTRAAMRNAMTSYFKITLRDARKNYKKYRTDNTPCGMAFVIKMLEPGYLDSPIDKPRRTEMITADEMRGLHKRDVKHVQ